MSILSTGGGRPAIKVEPPRGKGKPAPMAPAAEEKTAPEPGLVMIIIAWFILKARVYRWQLAPWYLALVILFASLGDRLNNAALLIACAAALGALSLERRPSWHGRVLARAIKRDKRSCRRGANHLGAARPQHVFRLALIERRAAAFGLAAGVVWLAITAYPMPFVLDLALLIAALSYPAWLWLTSPWRVKPTPLDPRTELILDAWIDIISVGKDALAPLRGSKIIRDSLEEIPGGGLTFMVRLQEIHPEDAVSDAVRKKIEAVLSPAPIRMPMNSVTLGAVRDDLGADRIKVTMSPTRHLEKKPVVWPGPVIDAKTGVVPVGVDVGGTEICVRIFDDVGAMPFMASGATKMGKSVTTLANVAPGVLSDEVGELVIYVDGGRGSSSRVLNKMATMFAKTPAEWEAALQIANAICVDRQSQMAPLGVDEWDVQTSPFRLITLVISEPSTVMNGTSKGRETEFENFTEICRKTGMRWGQEPQNTRSDKMMGGINAKNQVVANGSIFIHFSGGHSAASSATDGLEVSGIHSAAMSLPAVRGMAVIASEKNVISKAARIYNCKEPLDQLVDEKIADGWTPPGFSERELEIAAAFGWTPEGGFGEKPAGPALPELLPVTESPSMHTRTKIREALRQCPEGLKVVQIAELTGISRPTIDRHRGEMSDIVDCGSGLYRLAEFVLGGIQDTPNEGDPMSDADGQAAA